MKARAATFAAAILASALSGADLLAATDNAEKAADPCLTSPRDYTPPGSRWRYRIERPSGRNCWYLKDDADKSARKTPGQAVAETEEPAAAGAAHRKPAAPRALSDARAELAQAPVEQDPRPPAAPAAEISPAAAKSASLLAPAPAPRWPAPASAVNSAGDPPAPPPVPAEQNAELRPAPATSPPAKPQAMPRAVPPMPVSEKPMSLPMLITVVAGGLSVFGVIGSMLLAWRSSRAAPGVPMPETPDRPRRPGDLYRERQRMRGVKGGRHAA